MSHLFLSRNCTTTAAQMKAAQMSAAQGQYASMVRGRPFPPFLGERGSTDWDPPYVLNRTLFCDRI
jgi:hypothetical protein|eukprot:COSAG01_NODE_3290_length_6307_cov_2.975519_7_plen_66_part_00